MGTELWLVVVAIQHRPDNKPAIVRVKGSRHFTVSAVGAEYVAVSRDVLDFIPTWEGVTVVLACFFVSEVCHRRSLVRGKRTP